MRLITVAALLIVAATAGFGLGRATVRSDVVEATTERTERELTARIGDAVRVPSLALYCVSYVELDRPKLLCERTSKRPRHEVIFERDRTLVVRIGDPGSQKAFPER